MCELDPDGLSRSRPLLRREGLRVRSGKAETFVRRVDELALPEHLKSEIAALVDRTEAACRKLLERARDNVAKEKRLFAASPEAILTSTLHGNWDRFCSRC